MCMQCTLYIQRRSVRATNEEREDEEVITNGLCLLRGVYCTYIIYTGCLAVVSDPVNIIFLFLIIWKVATWFWKVITAAIVIIIFILHLCLFVFFT